MKSVFLTMFCFAISISVVAEGQDYVAPEKASAENPIAIPADHKAIVESAAIVQAVKSDTFFTLAKQVKEEKLREIIANSQKAQAEAKAAKVDAEKGTVIREAPPSIDYSQKMVVPNTKVDESAKKNELIREERALLEGTQLASVSSGSVVLRSQFGLFEISVGGETNGIVLKSINQENSSAVISSKKTGLLRTLKINPYAQIATGQIKPLKVKSE